jgi:transposase
MSLHAPSRDVIPEQTIQVARAAFPKGNPYMRMRDALGPIYTNATFAALFSHTGRPAEAPAQLALITVMPCAEGLSDAQAAEAVRARIDWKYALTLELTDPGFDASVLCEFRPRLIAGNAELLLFETMLTRLREQRLLKAKGRQRTDSTHVLAAIQTRNRLECVGETLRHALHVLATAAPDWRQSWVPAAWCERYSRRFADYRLPPERPARYVLAEHMGTDGHPWLWAIYAPATPAWLRALPAIETGRQVWLQQFYATAEGQPVHWRSAEDLPPAPLLISSPYDPEARYSKKRETEWTGYKVPVTETCDDETPHLITDVTTTPATTSDFAVLPTIQAHLATRQLTPGEQLVDVGYVTSDHLLTSRTAYGIDLLGPVMADQSWQELAGKGFAAAHCVIDWDATCALCPQGQRRVVWRERPDRHGHATVRIAFSKPVCAACASRVDCTRAASAPRALRLREREHHTALQAARVRQQTEAFKKAYARRAGIEGTMAQGTRTGDLRRSRSSGVVKTRLMHLLLATALNLMRVAAWLADIPRAQTRPSACAALAAAASR